MTWKVVVKKLVVARLSSFPFPPPLGSSIFFPKLPPFPTLCPLLLTPFLSTLTPSLPFSFLVCFTLASRLHLSPPASSLDKSTSNFGSSSLGIPSTALPHGPMPCSASSPIHSTLERMLLSLSAMLEAYSSPVPLSGHRKALTRKRLLLFL